MCGRRYTLGFAKLFEGPLRVDSEYDRDAVATKAWRHGRRAPKEKRSAAHVWSRHADSSAAPLVFTTGDWRRSETEDFSF
jgi:hypothetical protein